jgi:hypothetical protein
MTEIPEHVDEVGQPCERHPPGTLAALLELALVGSRMSSFNHDIASKLQGLMMALDEIGELAQTRGDAELGPAADTAQLALKELNDLLTQNRALTKPPVKTASLIRDLVVKAGARVGVHVRGTLPDTAIEVAVPRTLQALALAIDVAAGPGRSRTLAVSVDGTTVQLPLAAQPGSASASELLALASWMFTRAGGALVCRADGVLAVRLI